MSLPISSLMTRRVSTVSTEDTIARVEAELDRLRLHAMPVVDPQGGLFGILSAVDLAHFHAAKKNPNSVRAWELCTYKPLCVAPDTPARRVAGMMVAKKVHHVLVTDGPRLLGIVSTFDFIRKLSRPPRSANRP